MTNPLKITELIQWLRDNRASPALWAGEVKITSVAFYAVSTVRDALSALALQSTLCSKNKPSDRQNMTKTTGAD